MTEATVLIPRAIPQAGLEHLRREGFDYEVLADDRDVTRDELLAAVPGREAIISVLSCKIDGALFDAAGPSLRVVANYAVGFNNVDLAEATKRGIAITNTPGVLTDATADLAWALIMAAARRVCEGDRMMRTGEFEGWAPQMLLGQDLLGKTLGIVGAGRIGRAVAKRSRGWEMDVLYTNRNPNPEFENEVRAKQVDLEMLCRESDIISVHVPLTPETKHMFGAKQFAQMKPTAIFINTARGPVHDEAALAEALDTGQIAGAGLDVYEDEPKVNPDLLKCEKAVLLPHIGSGTIQTRDRMAVMVAENVVAALRGQRPPTLVNTDLAQP